MVPRHSDALNGCKSVVAAGVCSKCHAYHITPKWCFQIRMCLTDLDHPTEHFELMGYNAIAKYFFKDMSAEEVRATRRMPVRCLMFCPSRAQVSTMSREERWDMVNEFEECAVCIHTITEYDIEIGKCRHSPYRIQVLPTAMLANSNANVPPAVTIVL